MTASKNQSDPGPGPEAKSDISVLLQEIDVSRETQKRLEDLAGLLEKWQRKINLVGPKTIPDVWRRHILDSAQLVPLIKDYAQRRPEPALRGPLILVDLGSGAGFPGLVLAIFSREWVFPAEIHLVESDQRKCAFLREAARITGADVTLHMGRIEEIDPFSAHIVTARACAPLDRLLEYSERFWSDYTEGLFLKGQDVANEKVQAAISWGMVTKLVPSRSDPSGIILSVTHLRKLA